MRRLVIAVVAMLCGVALVVGGAGSAHAATGVTINKISAPAVSPGAKVTVRPNISTVGSVKITKKFFSVYRSGSGQRIVLQKASALLGAGSYRVKTTVAYKIKKRSGKYGHTTTKTRWQTLVIATSTATCATAADADRLSPGDTKTAVDATLHSPGVLDWSQTEDGVLHEHWRYDYCGSEVQWVWASFDDGLLGDSWIE